jgi:S-disulfanyl-L-cysteine oxidoreductase SoxD
MSAPLLRSLRSGYAAATWALGLAAALPVGAQGPGHKPAPDTGRSTLDGVYTLAQANQGRDVFAGMCRECHANNVYNGQPLKVRWDGRSLGELFGYLRRSMPKSNPGALTDDEYAQVIAYLLRLNQMPTGSAPLVADSAALAPIRLQSPPPPPPSRPELR